MSRSQYVWIITRPFGDERTGGEPIVAFTVKYECADWITRFSPGRVNVARLRDGHRHPEGRPVWLDPRTLDPYDEEEQRS